MGREPATETGTTATNTSPLDLGTEELKYAYRNLPTALAANLLLAVLLSLALWNTEPSHILGGWLAVIFVLVPVRAYIAYLFWHTPHQNRYTRLWLYLFIAGAVSHAALWGMSIWLFAPHDSLVAPILIVFAIGGLTAGASMTLGSMGSIFFSYILVILAPITLWFLLQSETQTTIMGVMLIVYMIGITASNRVYWKTFRSTVRLANQLAEAKRAAEDANKGKSKFLSRMSHELRTPLNAVLGFTQILKMEADQSSETGKCLDEIHMAGNHLLFLINDLLDLARMEAGEFELFQSRVDIARLLRECMSLMDPVAKNYQVELNLDGDDTAALEIFTDSSRLKQVLLNLLSNACKYSKPGGSILVQYERSGSAIRISVHDTGRGIAYEHQQNIFQSFDRLGLETSSIEGTGLGLSIAKHMVEQMNGKIGFTSTPGEGSTFWVEIPAPA